MQTTIKGIIMTVWTVLSCTHLPIKPTEINEDCLGKENAFIQFVAPQNPIFYLDCAQDMDWGIGIYTPTQKFGYIYPCFNQNNANQIAFVRSYTNRRPPQPDELCTLDVCTGEQKMLCANIIGDLQWSQNGWISFKRNDNQIWKIKPNGDSLSLISFGGSYNNHFDWNNEGTHCIYQKEAGGSYYNLMADAKGNVIDTLSDILAGRNNWDWGNNLIVYKGYHPNLGYGMFTYNVSNHQIKLVLGINSQEIQHINLQKWIEIDSIFICNMPNFILRTNIYTQQTDTLKKTGDNFYYLNFASSINYLIAPRFDRVYINPCLSEVSMNLYIMDKNGKEERKVIVPE